MYLKMLIFGIILITCNQTHPASEIINTDGYTISERFHPPAGYQRTESFPGSFAAYLRNLKLKPYGEKVRYHDGTPKLKRNVYLSVIDMDIGERDLQQCADAVMRLRAEYLFHQGRFDEIHFNFVSDGRPRYFRDFAGGDLSYSSFRKYMDYIFSYANTRSLHGEMIRVEDLTNMQIGDVFIQKGNPFGHAVIIVDMAADREGNILFMLAQSYMPAQDIQILVNQQNGHISPWYEIPPGELVTPEWTFLPGDLRRFPG